MAKSNKSKKVEKTSNKKSKPVVTEATTAVAADVKNNDARIAQLKAKLATKPPRHEQCRLRNQLRRLGHYGGLRQRTYVDKKTNETIIVEKTA